MQLEFLKDSSFIALENKAFDAIQRIFPCETELLDKVPLDAIVGHWEEKLNPTVSPILIRISR